MIKKISLMGLELDDYSFPEAIKIIESFLADTVLSVVLAVDMERLLRAGEDPAVKEIISEADYTVITDKAIPEAVPGSSGSARVSELEERAFLTAFLNHMYREDRTFYLVGASEQITNRMRDALQKSYSYIRIVGESAVHEDFSDAENCVNAINILVPDVILSSLDTPQEEYFLKKYGTQICARIWYGAGKDPLLKEGGFSLIRWLRRMRTREAFRARMHH